ncbi:MAG: type III secretion system cytoplasmic ring protein SctQ [Chlamydiales bacterium]|nr:type III secretion system cytoplasmic ring protein SctQ [Chlamydiales bacterium]
MDKLKAFGDLSIALGVGEGIPQEDCLCIDVRISHPKATAWGRVICPPSFHRLFKKHFGQKSGESLSPFKDKQLSLHLKVEIGHTNLKMAQWDRLKVNDMLILDRCTYDVKAHKGTAALVLGRTPLFRLRFKEDHLKIIEYAHYQEEHISMDEDFSKEEEESKDDAAFLSGMHEEFSEDTEEHLWSVETPKEASDQEVVSVRDVPLTLSVEVARLQMSLEKLLELKPGNLIDLAVHPEQGVDLILNGKRVARGELVKLGEVIGVKILQIGS